MTKFLAQDILLINQTHKLIQDLQRRQMMAYDVLLLNLPDLKKESNTKTLIWDFVFNNEIGEMTLEDGQLKINNG